MQWTDECSLCTSEYCIPHTVRVHSPLPVHQWVPFNISTSFNSEDIFSNLHQHKLKGLITPPQLAEPKHINLGKLLTATEPPVHWTEHRTSWLTVLWLIIIVVVISLVTLFVLCRCYYCHSQENYSPCESDNLGYGFAPLVPKVSSAVSATIPTRNVIDKEPTPLYVPYPSAPMQQVKYSPRMIYPPPMD